MATLLFSQIDREASGNITYSQLASEIEYWEAAAPSPPSTPPRRPVPKERKPRRSSQGGKGGTGGTGGAPVQGQGWVGDKGSNAEAEVLEKLRTSLSAEQVGSE